MGRIPRVPEIMFCVKCRQNPYADFAYDGVMINPFEVLFVKVRKLLGRA